MDRAFTVWITFSNKINELALSYNNEKLSSGIELEEKIDVENEMEERGCRLWR